MAIVYMATNKIDDHRYIGITTQSLAVRRGKQIGRARRGERSDPFHEAIREHGIEAFYYEVLHETSSWEEALEIERRLIRELRPEYNSHRNGEHPGRRRRPRNADAPLRAKFTPLPGEEWRAVVGYDGRYAVSSLGRARSISREWRTAEGGFYRHAGRILKLSSNSSGYRWFVPGKGEPSTAIHVAVAAAFLGPRPEGHGVLHRDGDRSHNALSNLYYGTQKENMADRKRHGSYVGGPRNSLNLDSVREIKLLLGDMSHREIAKSFGVTPRTIRLIARGETYSYV